MKDLAHDDAAIAYQALCRLLASPGPAADLLKERLPPTSGEEARRIERWIAELADSKAAVRRQAENELRRLGEWARPSLEEARGSDIRPAHRERVQKLLGENGDTPIPEEPLRRLRSVELLERLGTPKARSVLEDLAKGAARDRLTQEARSAFGRLEKRTAAKR